MAAIRGLAAIVLQPLVDGRGGPATAVNGADDQRGAVDRIAGGEDLWIARLIIVHDNVALRIELQGRIFNKALMDDVYETRRQDHEVHFEEEIRPRDLFNLPIVVLSDPFDLAGVQSVGGDTRAA